jgi:hypothetical protein
MFCHCPFCLVEFTIKIMKIFYGATYIKIHSDDGTSPKLLNKAELAVYFQIKENEINEEHIKKWLNNEV